EVQPGVAVCMRLEGVGVTGAAGGGCAAGIGAADGAATGTGMATGAGTCNATAAGTSLTAGVQIELAAAIEGISGPGLPWPRPMQLAIPPPHLELGAQPQLRVLVGDDARTPRRQGLVAAGVVGMPVGIERGLHRSAFRNPVNQLQQGSGVLRLPPIHNSKPLLTLVDHDIPAGPRNERHP